MAILPLFAVTDSATWVARQLRHQRELRGWSQAELASRIGRTQTAVSYWEAGKRTPGLDDVIELCEAFDLSIDTFVLPERARQPVTALLRATAERLASNELTAEIDALLEDAHRKEIPPRRLTVSARQPAYAANELLEKAGISRPPVDVHKLARRCGVLVLERPFPDALSGLVFAHGDGAVVGVNSEHALVRRRFSVAHELGHFLLGHHETPADDSGLHIDVSDGTPPGFDWRAERAANDFAADLLMPRRMVMAEFARHPSPSELSRRFEVSEIAMGYRLVNLGLR
jgi:Zn-dependent peptidase ImmA (M78 family)/DNA-binding XRE family transcriptional regulator